MNSAFGPCVTFSESHMKCAPVCFTRTERLGSPSNPCCAARCSAMAAAWRRAAAANESFQRNGAFPWLRRASFTAANNSFSARASSGRASARFASVRLVRDWPYAPPQATIPAIAMTASRVLIRIRSLSQGAQNKTIRTRICGPSKITYVGESLSPKRILSIVRSLPVLGTPYPGLAFCNTNTRTCAELRGRQGKAVGGTPSVGRIMKQWYEKRRYFVFGRSLTGITNFNPDHTSVTAQTLMSTSPASSPLWRTKFSSRSEATPELFFGQEIQSMPAGARARAAGTRSSSRSGARFSEKKDKIKRARGQGSRGCTF